MSDRQALDVFFSYSHRDEDLRDELEVHLSILKRQGKIRPWHDRRIAGGREWAGEIDAYLQAADIVLLLVSPAFIASDYCWDKEMERALERHERGEARVIPIILRPVDWRGAPFGKLQALPRDARPVTTWPNRDEAFLNVAQGISAAIDDELRRRAARAAAPPSPARPAALPPASPPAPPARQTRTPDDGDDESFDVFLAYNSEDQAEVRTVAVRLRERGVKVWFDEWRLQPGSRVTDVLEQMLLASRTAAIFVGASGLGPWQKEEYHAALKRAVLEGHAMIPVLLPAAGKEPKLPPFLGNYAWVRFSQLDDREALGRLEWGITGRRPDFLG